MRLQQPTENERRRVRSARIVAVVLCVTMALWLALQWLGGHFGWATRWAFLFDLAALASFLWAMIVTVGLWRARKDG
jgi:Family of unknown function (DUF5337)